MHAEKKRSLLNEMSGLLGHAYGPYIGWRRDSISGCERIKWRPRFLSEMHNMHMLHLRLGAENLMLTVQIHRSRETNSLIDN